MFKVFKKIVLASFAAVFVVACGGSETDDSANKPTKPLVVQLAEVSSNTSGDSFTFPAKVRAYRNIDIAFQVPGKIETLNLVEGADLKKGDLLAALDDGPFKRNLRQAEVKMAQAKNDLARIKTLVADNIASQQDLDNAQTAYDLSQIDWENKKADLAYSRLTAPFDAKVSKRFVEENTYVGVGKSIVSLQDISQIYFEIQVPERLVSAYQGQVIRKAKAFIGGGINQTFDVVYAEHNTQPDATTQTYKVEFAMPYPSGVKISTGINASILVNAPNVNGGLMIVPLHALVAETNNEFSVWRYEEASNTVTKTKVQVGPIKGDYVPVISGLTPGDQVVVAGIAQMQEGLVVTPYVGE